MLARDEAREMEALAEYGGPGDGGHAVFTPTPGKEDLHGRVGPGACFRPDGKGGGKLYASAQPGARLVARVRRGP